MRKYTGSHSECMKDFHRQKKQKPYNKNNKQGNMGTSEIFKQNISIFFSCSFIPAHAARIFSTSILFTASYYIVLFLLIAVNAVNVH